MRIAAYFKFSGAKEAPVREVWAGHLKMTKRAGIAFTAVLAAVLILLASSKVLSAPQSASGDAASKTWTAPDPATIPSGPMGDSIRLGLNVFSDTPKYAAEYVGNKMACGHCHVGNGTVAYGIPLVGVPGLFPLYREREKEVVTLEERIEQCFQRSENGHPVPNARPEMVGLVAYMQWLSKGQVTGREVAGRGLEKLPALTGDPARGEAIFTQQCALCHGADGAGKPPTFPALWGPDAYNDGAGMNDPARMAAFVQHNMPQTNPGSLTPQQAYDVAAYVHSKPHTHFVMSEHQ
jgi:thiosulfate dehydrogenase